MMPDTSFATQKTMQSTLNSQPARDGSTEVVRLWNEGKEKLFEFCVKLSGFVGNYEVGRTQQIAALIGRSPTTVQNYAKVGHLWTATLQTYPSHAELLRDDLHVSHWLPVARLWDGGLVTLDGAFEWLKLCRKKKWTVEKFRTQLPTIEGRSEMAKTVKQLEFKVGGLIADIENFAVSPAFDVDIENYQEFYALLMAVKELAPLVMRRSEIEAEGKSAE